MENQLLKTINDVYAHESGNIAVTIIDDDTAEIWCNVEGPADTEPLKAKYDDWLRSIFNIYGIDYRDAEFDRWYAGPHPETAREGIIDFVRT